jgi:hypothetical protein
VAARAPEFVAFVVAVAEFMLYLGEKGFHLSAVCY